MEMNRRDVCVAMAALASLGSLPAEAQEGAPAGEDGSLMLSKVFRFSEMKETPSPGNGGWTRPVMRGVLPTGETVQVHETMLPVGKLLHTPHANKTAEIAMIREGKLQFMNVDKPEEAGPGDIIYTAPNQMHSLTNVGDTPALYFVVSVGNSKA